jgi:hypothetical protein
MLLVLKLVMLLVLKLRDVIGSQAWFSSKFSIGSQILIGFRDVIGYWFSTFVDMRRISR